MDLKRESYLEKIRPFYETDLIKVITGVRRGGKSTLLKTIKDEIIETGVSSDQIIFINLEDMLYDHIKNANDLYEEINPRIINDKKYYIFIDEVQHVDAFEKALASLRTGNTSVFVTGSDSTLLSGELATLLTGRVIDFEVLPFSYMEMKDYLELNNRKYDDDLIYDYIKWGGFPLRFSFNREEDVRKYLETLYDQIVERDIKKKSSRFNTKVFKDIASYMMANAGKEFSADNIVNYYKTHNAQTISRQTVYNYLEKMEKAYLIHSVEKYDVSGKKAMKSNEKYYAIDPGFRIINTNTFDFEDTFFLENVIYNDLLSDGFSVRTGRLNDGEIDFVASKDGKKCYIQVTYLLASEATIQREFGAFDKVRDASPKYVLSLDKADMSRNGIVHLNITDYLLKKSKLMLT